MSYLIKHFGPYKTVLSILFLLVSVQFTHGQLVTGPSSVNPNSTHTYNFDTGTIYSPKLKWTVTGGSVLLAGKNGTEYFVNVQWGAAGTGTVTCKSGLILLGSKTVTIGAPAPAAPSMPSVANSPGYTRLTRGTPPTGEVWYWQSSSSGTSTSNPSIYVDRPYGTTQYFIKAYNSSSNQWSVATTINYTVDPGTSSPATNLSDENYIHSVTPRVATTNPSILTNEQKIETVTYFDGLGRPIQSVAIRAGGNYEDVITHMEYDNLGRQNKSYLPYASSTDTGNYRTSALTATNSFYNTAKYENTTNPYGETLFDGTPLNLVVEQAAPGNDWKQGNTEEHTIKNEYKLIETSDYVRNYKINNSNGTLVDNGYYAMGEVTVQGAFNTPNVFKFITKNENWVTGDLNDNTIHTFKDYRGRVILNRTFENQVKHDTYYVYDSYGNLVYVLPPKADPSTAKPDATELSELCFQYKYDDKNRLIEKKIPGKGWEYIVYNTLDQPVLTQDSALDAQGKWLFTKYDRFGRVAYTGITNNTSSRSALQTTLDATSSTYVTKSSSSISLGGATVYYNNGAYPTSIAEIHTINYYDDYTFDKDGLSLPSSYEGQTIINHNNTNKLLTNGLATGSKVRILDSSPVKWITTITGYDVKGRSIYVTSKNQYLNTTDIIKSKLDFVGAVDKTETSHTGSTSVDTEDLFTYDHMGRLNKQTQELNSTNVLEVLVDNTYDELGQLIGKGVGGKTTQSRLQNVDYNYNIRGWLKSINNVTSLGTDLFGFKINYNTIDHHSGNDKKQYNGNISEIEWKTSNDNALRWYKYEYDDLNRVTSAVDNINRYSLSGMQYDKNGNITNLTRKGHIVANPVSTTSSHFGNMDVLTYDYLPKTNKLSIVSDTANDTYGFKDDQIGGGTDTSVDYTYDINGNMSTDTNKGITAITYNHLNLPTQVTLGSGNISYIYDALGTKLSKTVGSTITYYAGNYQYEGSSLKFFNHAEGYVEPDGSGGYDYVYQFTDHLGNIRLSYKDISTTSTPNLQIQEENNYYPFGLKHRGYNGGIIGNDHKYGFGGKEEQDDNVSGKQLDWLDFHARNYDAALGRWMNLDPLADSEMQFNQSPYAYTWNNPVNLTDFTGMHPDDTEYDWRKAARAGETVNVLGGGLSFDGNSFTAKDARVQKTSTKEKTTSNNINQQENLEPGTVILPEVVVEGKSNLSYKRAAFQIQANILSTSYYDYLRWNFSQRENTMADNWATGNFIQRGIYETANSFSIFTQSMNPFDNQVTNLRGSYVGHKDNSEHGAIVSATLIPIGSAKIAAGPTKNWIRGVFKPHRSYSKFWSTKTKWSVSWGASPARNGKYLKQIPSSTLRNLNIKLRQTRLPFIKNWRTLDRGHFHIKL
ncbi:DUF6443 domain-containing protein [Jejuia spongiicola]|uniref:DUF6443 domain-containing protein n=1 Tax=Jejuia spongiicola TaxID=2942207 RepID=A0ABT0QAG6_9FLAO|nr:DUF6443 domain-containing protein [Jejuia spongiicola]MCL6293889.1 DUF6443 domain-containing protein [Jejuia spongiicola]